MIYWNANGALLAHFALTTNGLEADLMDIRRHVAWAILGCIIWNKWRRRGEGEVPECHLVLRSPVLSLIVDSPLHHREEDAIIYIMTRASISVRVLGMKTKKRMMRMMRKTTRTGQKTAVTPQMALMTGRDSV